jgi:hypothetical protein
VHVVPDTAAAYHTLVRELSEYPAFLRSHDRAEQATAIDRALRAVREWSADPVRAAPPAATRCLTLGGEPPFAYLRVLRR